MTDGNPKINAKLTAHRVGKAYYRSMTTLDNPGFCIDCGHEQDGCEPDARNYKCNNCGKHEVFGASEILITFILH